MFKGILFRGEQQLDLAVEDVWAAVMISASPALSSAPSSIGPSVVVMSLPIWSRAPVLADADDELRVTEQLDIAALIVR